MKYAIVIFVLVPMLMLTGCISGGVGSADFSLDKFFGNPIVIIAVIALIIWMWSRGKK